MIKIERGNNPYHDEVQGKANESITVSGLLDRAGDPAHPLEEICERLDANAPRIAIIGGSPDHPAHISDDATAWKAARRIWTNGGVPFYFSIPVMCDGTAQSALGMCYSLQSRNAAAAMVVNQMESHAYHGAFVLQGCDKTPTALVNALSLLDITRQRRDDAPVFAEVFEKFLGYLGTDILVGYHVRFDLHFLNVYMRQTHGFPVQNLVLDAQSMCRKVCFPPHLRSYAGKLKGNQDLDTVAKHFGIEIQERHTALGDALATAMIFQRILDEIEKNGPGRLKNLLAIDRNV